MKILEKIQDKFESAKFSLEDWIEIVREMGLRFYLFRKIVPCWNGDAIIKHVVNKQFAIIGKKTPEGSKDWFSYLVKTENHDWFREYHFEDKEQEYKLMKCFYRWLKLRYLNYWFASDEYIYNHWPMASLCYIFSIDDEKKWSDHYDIKSISYKDKWWWKLFMLLMCGKTTDDFE